MGWVFCVFAELLIGCTLFVYLVVDLWLGLWFYFACVFTVRFDVLLLIDLLFYL